MAQDGRMLVGLALAAGCVLAAPVAATEAMAQSQGRQQQIQKSQQAGSVSRLFEELQLSTEQRASCLAVVRQGWEHNRELRRQARDTWHELMAALRRPGVSLEEALATQRKLARYQELLAEKRIETFFAFRRLLTPAQIDRLSSLRLDTTFWLEEDDGDGEPRSTKPRRNDVP